jgi:hypothetical protein
VSPTNGAALENSDFSPAVSQKELRELDGGFPELKLLFLCHCRSLRVTVTRGWRIEDPDDMTDTEEDVQMMKVRYKPCHLSSGNPPYGRLNQPG